MDSNNVALENQMQQVQTPVIQPIQKKTKVFKFVVICVALLILIGSIYYWIKPASSQSSIIKPEKSKVSTQQSLTPLDKTVNWKTVTVENVVFKYPSDWREAINVATNGATVKEFITTNSESRLVFITGVNKGALPEENEAFLNKYASHGGQLLSVDTGVASIREIENGEITLITAFIASNDKQDVYAFTLQSKSQNGNARLLFDDILSTVTFIDN